MPSPTKFGALEERPRHWHSIFLDPFARCCLTVIDFVSSSTELPENSQRIEEERNTRLRLVMAREKGALELNGQWAPSASSLQYNIPFLLFLFFLLICLWIIFCNYIYLCIHTIFNLFMSILRCVIGKLWFLLFLSLLFRNSIDK